MNVQFLRLALLVALIIISVVSGEDGTTTGAPTSMAPTTGTPTIQNVATKTPTTKPASFPPCGYSEKLGLFCTNGKKCCKFDGGNSCACEIDFPEEDNGNGKDEKNKDDSDSSDDKPSFWDKASSFLNENWVWVAVGCGGFVAILGIGFLARHLRKRRKERKKDKKKKKELEAAAQFFEKVCVDNPLAVNVHSVKMPNVSGGRPIYEKSYSSFL